jgi:thioredoxin family protein
MTLQKESVVSPERFEKGISWADWMARIDRNQDKFAENYEGFNPDPADIAAIKDLVQRGASRCLALGEAWCPDVFRGLPVIAKVAEQTGMDLKIFFRDENLDIMNEFLNRGEFQSIPTLVFYTKDHRYLGHWIERAKKVADEMPLMTAISGKLRDPAISPEEREKYMAEYADFQRGPIWRGWQDAQVKEIRQLIESNFKG